MSGTRKPGGAALTAKRLLVLSLAFALCIGCDVLPERRQRIGADSTPKYVPSAADKTLGGAMAAKDDGSTADVPKEVIETPRNKGPLGCQWRRQLNESWCGGDCVTRQQRDSWLKHFGALLTPAKAENEVAVLARRALAAVVERRFVDLAWMSHPKHGLTLGANKGDTTNVLTRSEVANCGRSTKLRDWSGGCQCGSEGFQATCNELFEDELTKRDFLRKGEVSYNCFPSVARGNYNVPLMIEHGRVYAQFFVVEEDGAAFSALWLVFDGKPGQWWLTGLFVEC